MAGRAISTLHRRHTTLPCTLYSLETQPALLRVALRCDAGHSPDGICGPTAHNTASASKSTMVSRMTQRVANAPASVVTTSARGSATGAPPAGSSTSGGRETEKSLCAADRAMSV